MWKRIAISVALLGAAPAPAQPEGRVAISGPIRKMAVNPAPGEIPLIGIVADSQLQTRVQNAEIPIWRDARSDTYLEDVTIRPPALDWSARYLLEAHLKRLVQGGAKAIFFLGDGANNGCHDEFLNGFGTRAKMEENDRGVLRLLEDFRLESGVPVYFVLGNHDFLAAGSTSQVKSARRPLCDDEPNKPGANQPLSRYEVIKAIDEFNRANAGFADGFAADYVSTFGSEMRQHCLGSNAPPIKNEHRRRGCHYAAVLDFPNSRAPVAQFFLVDTTDYVDVMPFKPFGKQLESVRGATSFKSPLSQTAFFRRHADRAGRIPLRFALMHYPVNALTLRRAPIVGKLLGVPGYSQRFLDLFVADPGDGAPPRLRQQDGFVLSGHTHEPAEPRLTDYKAFGGLYSIGELNVGSTTDHPGHAALVRVARPAGARATLEYRVVQLSEDECDPVYAAIGNDMWKTDFGIDFESPKNYRRFSAGDKKAVFDKLADFVARDTREMRLLKARCIGRMSSWVENEHYPWSFAFPR